MLPGSYWDSSTLTLPNTSSLVSQLPPSPISESHLSELGVWVDVWVPPDCVRTRSEVNETSLHGRTVWSYGGPDMVRTDRSDSHSGWVQLGPNVRRRSDPSPWTQGVTPTTSPRDLLGPTPLDRPSRGSNLRVWSYVQVGRSTDSGELVRGSTVYSHVTRPSPIGPRTQVREFESGSPLRTRGVREET